MERSAERTLWIQQVCGLAGDLSFASADASLRSYFRVKTADMSYILMDDPSSIEQSSVPSFLHVQALMSCYALPVPDIFFADASRGFVLLSDFGDISYLQALSLVPHEVLYPLAIGSLLQMRQIPEGSGLPIYDEGLLYKELALFESYYLETRSDVDPLIAFWPGLAEALVRYCVSMPAVFVHRDFHSRNLMYDNPNIGILDFQDAVWGPRLYDVASLLRDAYVDLSPDEEAYYLKIFCQGSESGCSWDTLYREYMLISFQRHLKIVGIFKRLYLRGKKRYVADIPRVMRYLKEEASFLKYESSLYDFCSALEEHCDTWMAS